MGSFWGTLAGALLLGVTKQIGFRVDLGWDIWFGRSLSTPGTGVPGTADLAQR